MSYFLGIVLGLSGLVMLLVLWGKLPRDEIGRTDRRRRYQHGVQGRLSEFLYWDALLEGRHSDDSAVAGPYTRTGDRALSMVVSRYQTENRLEREDARSGLQREVQSRAAKAFLAGDMDQAIIAHWRARYRGPRPLFRLWFHLVARIRYGHRHMYLDTLTFILQEIQGHEPTRRT